MASIKFDITGDNSSFIQMMKGVQAQVKTTTDVLDSLNDEFNLNGVNEQFRALTKRVREYEESILKSKEKIARYMDDAIELRSSGDFEGFEKIQKDIDEEIKSYEELVEEANKYKTALTEIMSVGGLGSTGKKAPMLFSTNEDFSAYQALLEKREEIQSNIANLDIDGMSIEEVTIKLLEMRSALTPLNDEINKTEINAAKSAAALGENGAKAAEATENYYHLCQAVEQQLAVVNNIQNELNAVEERYKNAVNSRDLDEASVSQLELDKLNESLHSEEMELINLKNAQESARREAEAYTDTSVSLRQQLMEATKELGNITYQYRNMTEEEKNSAKGKELEEKMNQLIKKAGVLKDTIRDVSEEIGAESSDTSSINALAGGINVVTSSIGAATGVAAMFGVEQEKLLDVQAKLQASLAISNALTVIQNNLQKESALMLGIRKMQEGATAAAIAIRTAAEGKGVLVTRAATLAQEAFNLVAKANPYVLLATGIGAVIAAYIGFSSETKEATELTKEQDEAMKKATETASTYSSTLSNSFAQLMTKYSSLKAEWKSLRTEHEKAEFIKDNKQDFDSLGESIDDVRSAESYFNNNTNEVVNSFIRRAKAAARLAELTEQYRLQMELIDKKATLSTKFAQEVGSNAKRPGDIVDEAWYEKNKFQGGQSSVAIYDEKTGKRRLTDLGARLYNGQFANTQTYIELTQAEIDYQDSVQKTNKLIEQIEDDVKNNRPVGGAPTTPTVRGGGNDDNERRKRLAQEISEERKHQQELMDLRRQAAEARTQANIAAISDDGERERAEHEEQHKKTLEELNEQIDQIYKDIYERRKSAWERENKDTPYELTPEGSIDPTKKDEEGKYFMALTEEEKEYFNLRSEIIQAGLDKENLIYSRTLEQRTQTERRAMLEYLREFGTIEQQRLAIVEEYEEKIRKARTEGERNTLIAQQQQALREFDTKNIKDKLNFEDLFNNLEYLSIEKLQELKTQLKDMMTTDMGLDEYKTAAEQIQKINETILDLEDKQHTVLGMIIQRGQERRRLEMEVKDTQDLQRQMTEELAKAVNGVEDAQKAVASALLNTLQISASGVMTGKGTVADQKITGSNRDAIMAQSAKVFGVGSAEYEKVKNAMDDLVKAENTLTDTQKKKEATDKNAEGAQKKLNQYIGDFQKRLQDLMPTLQQINANLQSLPGLFDALGLGDTGIGKMASGIAESANSAMSAVSDFASGNYIGAAMNAINALNTFGDSIGLWSNSNRAEVEKENERLSQSMSLNTEAINRLTEEMKKSSPKEAYEKYKEALAEMQAKEQSARNQLINNAYLYDGGHSLNYDVGSGGGGFNWRTGIRNKGLIEQIFEYVGLTPNGDYDLGGLLRTLSASDWNKLYDDERGRDLLSQLQQAIYSAEDEGNYNGLFQDLLDYMNEYGEEAYNALQDTFRESVTGVSFDSFKDKFRSSLMDMSKDAKGFSDDFSEMLMQSVLNAQIESAFGEELEDLYKEWADALSDDNFIDEEELAKLQGWQDDLTRRMINLRDTIATATGYDKTVKDKTSTANMAEKATYDQFELYLGIATAQQIALEQGNQTREVLLESVRSLMQFNTGQASAMSELRNLALIRNEYLMDIKKSNRDILDTVTDKMDRTIGLLNQLV